MLTVHNVAPDDPTALNMWAEQQREMRLLYGGNGDETTDRKISLDGIISSFVGRDAQDKPVACGMVRWSFFDTGPGSAEVKRVYVVPEHRGEGHSKVIMGAIEEAARRAGATNIVLETGTLQPEAIGLYERVGYHRIPGYGEYAGYPLSVCFGKSLPTRVLVVNGTIGAGKTAIACALAGTLASRGARCAWIDGDTLCQAEPPIPGDPYIQGLLFDALAGAAPAYRGRGFGIVVVARVVEDAADRDRYSQAFRSDAGPAEVTMLRVTAGETAVGLLDALGW